MKDYWEKTALGLLRAEMSRQNISYKELSTRLEKIGVHEHEKQLMNKVARGKFAVTFFLQCMCVLDVHYVQVPRFSDIELE